MTAPDPAAASEPVAEAPKPSGSGDAAPEPHPGHRSERDWGWVRPFLVRILINTLTLLGLLALFSLIRLPGQNSESRYILDEPVLEISNAGILEFFLIGLSLAVVGVIVRPVLTALSGSLVVRTYGLMIVVINVIVFWLAMELVTLLTHVHIGVPDPRILWVTAVALLFSTAIRTRATSS